MSFHPSLSTQVAVNDCHHPFPEPPVFPNQPGPFRPKLSTAWEFLLYKPNAPGLACEYYLEVIIGLYVLILFGMLPTMFLSFIASTSPTQPCPLILLLDQISFLAFGQKVPIGIHGSIPCVHAHVCAHVNSSLMSTNNNNLCEKARLMLM